MTLRVVLYATGVFFWPENMQTRLHVLWCTWQGCFCDLRACRHDIRVVLYVTGVFFWPPTWQQADMTSRVVLWHGSFFLVFFWPPTWEHADMTSRVVLWREFLLWPPTWEHADMTSRVVLWRELVFFWPPTWEHADMTSRVVLWREFFFSDPRPENMQTWLHVLCCDGGVLVTLDRIPCKHDFTRCAVTGVFFLTFGLRTGRPDFTCCAVTGVFLWPLTGDHADITSRVVLCRGCFCDLRPKNMQTWRHVLCCAGGVFVTFDPRTCRHDVTCCAVTVVFCDPWPETMQTWLHVLCCDSFFDCLFLFLLVFDCLLCFVVVCVCFWLLVVICTPEPAGWGHADLT